MLTVEHRAAPSLAPIAIALAQRGPALALEVVDPPEASTSAQPVAPGPGTLDERIAAALAEIAGAMPFAELRTRCRVRAATLYERLAVSPTPDASPRPTKATASLATDRRTTDNHHETGAQAPNSQFRFPPSLQRAGTGIGKSGQGGTDLPHASLKCREHRSIKLRDRAYFDDDGRAGDSLWWRRNDGFGLGRQSIVGRTAR